MYDGITSTTPITSMSNDGDATATGWMYQGAVIHSDQDAVYFMDVYRVEQIDFICFFIARHDMQPPLSYFLISPEVQLSPRAMSKGTCPQVSLRRSHIPNRKAL